MSNERRKYPRLRLQAQVKLTRAGDAYTMPTLDVSLSGLFVMATPSAFPDLDIGAVVDVVLQPPAALATDGASAVQASARIVRIESGGVRHSGFGLEFERIDGDNMRCLGAMIKTITDAG